VISRLQLSLDVMCDALLWISSPDGLTSRKLTGVQ
jgi:hypothetical protein